DLLRRGEDEDVAKAFAREAAERAPQLLDVLLDDPRPEGAVGPRAIALDADPLRQVEDDGDGNTVVLARESDERLARRGLDVGRVEEGEGGSGKPLGGNVVQDVKGVLRRRLAVLVVRDEPPAEVRREHLRRLEVRPGKGRLPGARGADQDDERELGDDDIHDG